MTIIFYDVHSSILNDLSFEIKRQDVLFRTKFV